DGPDDQKQAQPVLLRDLILEKMSDGQEWDAPRLRIALDYPPHRSVNIAMQKMFEEGEIELVRVVSMGSARRKIYRKVVK
ncbi:hypothetical protein RZS08_12805, partial [Arthrospira platensis SPKY1]|nr:hypothetical protein [Arthrospira platensis SPKY1]